MNPMFRKPIRGKQALSAITFLTLVMGCGAVGAPIPPEDVGIEAKVRKQQRENLQPADTPPQEDSIPVKEENIELPTFYPIGTR